MNDRLTSLDDLRQAGLVAGDAVGPLSAVAARYAVALTRDVADLIDKDAGALDPIARQFVPSEAEAETKPFERADPIGDGAMSPVPGIVHRYPDRVLLKAAASCPVYCRFCFRREMVGPDHGRGLTSAQWAGACDYIADHPEIWEVIVTGGDPFVLSDRRVRDITERLDGIGHVAVIRWHTRVPVVEPGRITADLVCALRAKRAATYVAIHANHPRELMPEACNAIARLVDAGIVCRSQTVLLRGVNDDHDTLAALMRAFVRNRVVPYYLHQLDPAPGTSHFRVPLAEAQALVSGLRGHISGLCQPEFVIDIPGGAGKVRAAAATVVHQPDGNVYLIDRNGTLHRYDEAGAGIGNSHGSARPHAVDPE